MVGIGRRPSIFTAARGSSVRIMALVKEASTGTVRTTAVTTTSFALF